MTTATVSAAPRGLRGIDRLALRTGTALVLWAGRRAERGALTPERRSHRIALQRIELDRDTAARSAMLGR
jgi:hypothetical protein